MRLQVTVSGVDALSLRVKYLIEAAQFGLAAGVAEAGLLFETEAKALVPVDTGRLRDSIHTEPLIDEPARQVLAVTPAYEAANRYGFDPAYARRIEWGFTGPDSLGRMFHQPAQPYMRPAYDGKQQEAAATIKTSIREELINASSGAAGNRMRRLG